MNPTDYNSPADENRAPYDAYNSPKRSRAKLIILILAGTAACILAVVAIIFIRGKALDQESEPSAAAAQVTISSQSYTPGTIQIKQGQGVMWANEDELPHAIMIDGLEGADSPEQINQGEAYSYIFDAPGKYIYYDVNDPLRMQGVVVVE